MSNNDNDDVSTQEDCVSDNDNTTSTTNPPDASPAWMQLMAMANGSDDANNNDPDYYDNFQSKYDLDDDGAFDNDDAEVGESYVYMTLTKDWLPPEEQYDADNILICPGVIFDV